MGTVLYGSALYCTAPPTCVAMKRPTPLRAAAPPLRCAMCAAVVGGAMTGVKPTSSSYVSTPTAHTSVG